MKNNNYLLETTMQKIQHLNRTGTRDSSSYLYYKYSYGDWRQI